MACPPEDSSGFEGMGNRAYQDFLHDLLAAKANASSHSQRKFRKLCAEATGALNYKDRSVGQCLFCFVVSSCINTCAFKPGCLMSHN